EEALHQSEEQLNRIFNTTADGMRVVDKDFKIIRMNDTLASMTGVSIEDAMELKCHEAFGGAFCHSENCPLTRILGGEERITMDIDKETLAGVKIPCILSATLFKDSRGAVIGIVEAFRDITNRKRAEEELRESEEKYRAILENIEDGYYEVDLSGSFTFFNKSLCIILGHSEDELMGMNYRAYTNDNRSETVYQAFNNVYRTKKPTKIFDWKVIRKDGTRRLVETSISLMVDSAGEPFGFRGIVRDITERKRAERAVQRSEERFRTIFEESPIGIDVFDSDGILIEGNKACLDVFGVSLDDLRGFYLFDDPNVPEEAKKRIRNGETVRYQAPFDFEKVKERGSYETSKSGIAYLNTVITPFGLGEDGSFRGYIVQMQDVTELKQNEEQRRQQHSELEVYASLLRHDLRNDVGVILGNVDLAKMIAGENDSEILETLSSTEAVCERMMNLLKAVSRPADSIEKNIVALVRIVSSQAQGAHAKLTVNVTVNDDAEELTIVGNRLLPMVFENLLRNAAVHAGENPIVDMIISKEGSNVQVLVSDNGPGVPEEVRNRLFHRGVSTSGGGLGLHLSKSIVNAMNGSIELMNTDPGEGSTFKILLPLTV
ncbi:MAG: PAS domain S-box protein, partial [Candidatus Thorarchaeota archaeon]